jgi:hypothetical protein
MAGLNGLNGGGHREARSRNGNSGYDTPRSPSRTSRDGRRGGAGGGGGGRSGSESSPSGLGRRSSTAREEERRKVLEIEQANRGAAATLGRTGSRASRLAGGQGPRVSARPRQVHGDEGDSQVSGHSSSSASAMRREPPGSSQTMPSTRRGVRRSTSNATGPRPAPVLKKVPVSLTSSLNSSADSDVQGRGEGHQRSVYLHNACVADIPPNATDTGGRRPTRPPGGANGFPGPPPARALSAESRDKMATSSSRPSQPSASSNLEKSKKLSRSISMLAPWRRTPTQPRPPPEILYDNENIYGQGGGVAGAGSAKPPRPPPPPPSARKGPPGPSTFARDRAKSASSGNLLREAPPPPPHQQPPRVSGQRANPVQVGEILDEGGRGSKKPTTAKVSRSISMPKDTRLAGWFKRKRKA